MTMLAGVLAGCLAPGQASAPAATPPAPATEFDENCYEDTPCTLEPGTYTFVDDVAPDGTLLPGLTMSTEETWTISELWIGELLLSPDADTGHAIRIWIDMAGARDGATVEVDGPPSADELTEWLLANDEHDASAVTDVTLGRDRIPARSLVLTVSDTATTDAAIEGCPCPELVGRPDWWCCFGMAAEDHMRLYLADIGSAEAPHTLAVSLLAPGADALAALEARALPVLDSLVLPDELVVYCGPDVPPRRC
jgi:hypothetical protein